MGACCSSTSIEGNGENSNSNRNNSSNGERNSLEEEPPPDNPRELYSEIEELQRDLSIMEAFFQSVLGQAYQMGIVDPEVLGAQQQQRGENNAPPPASQKAMRQIPTVALCAEDLMDENNRECCICFEENIIGVKVARLPCGHVYHRPCIEGWLCKHCTCPVCRYELETDDPSYERGRLERMRHRKPRFRKHELNNMSIRQLRDLLVFLKLNDAGTFTEKREIVDKIISSGRIEVIASPQPLEFKLSELRAMGVGKLKRAMNEAGVFFDPADVVEKEDMVQLFINSGRVILLADTAEDDLDTSPVTNSETMEIDNHAIEINNSKVARAHSSMQDDSDDNHDEINAQENTSSNLKSEDLELDNTNSNENAPNGHALSLNNETSSDPSSSRLKSYLRSKTISELKAMGRELGVNLLDCVEKAEMVDKLSPFFNG